MDTRRHDRELRTVANAIKETCSDLHAFAARWGGDEFMIVAKKSTITSPSSLIDTLEDRLDATHDAAKFEYPLTISVGYSSCSSPDTAKELLEKEADDMLYAEKDAFYASNSYAVSQTA